MNRYEYLNLKYSPDYTLPKVLRIEFIVAAVIILIGVIHNVGILLWTVARLMGFR